MKRLLTLLLVLACFVAACNDNELGIDKRKPNRAPETILSSGPPDSTDSTVYRVHLFWSGTDPDGRIDHYDFILIDHPPAASSIDGAGNPDSTVIVRIPTADDPRWAGTTATDSIFVTLADTLRRDPQPEEGEQPGVVRNSNFERWHTFFVRAVDDEGTIDESPDYRSFNSVNIAPVVFLTDPIQNNALFKGPPVIVFNWDGTDPVGDGTDLDPVASRWVIIPSNVNFLGEYESFPDSLYNLPERFEWSPWHRWEAADQSGRRQVVAGLSLKGDFRGAGQYLFAVQVMDEAGAITPVFDWQSNLKNNVVQISVQGDVGPVLSVREKFLGVQRFVGGSRPVRLDIAASQPIEFTWSADASAYGGEIVGYRYGWNILDTNDDQQWDTSWGLSNRKSVTRVFASGSQRFFLQVRDNAESITEAQYELTTNQITLLRDLMWVDDTIEIIPGSGVEQQEDDQWRKAMQAAALQNDFTFLPGRDIFDLTENRNRVPPIDKVFDYKAIIWSVRSSAQGSGLGGLAGFIDPFAARNQNALASFNYLNIYIKNKGKLWVTGFRPGLQIWPRERCVGCGFDPVNVTNWDDPIQPHPQIDSVGTLSMLYTMGVEMFDVGAVIGSPRRNLDQYCQGFNRGAPLGSERQITFSDQVQGHAHRAQLLTTDVDNPPDSVVITTSVDLEHTHTLVLRRDDFLALQTGATVVVETAISTDPRTHFHTYEFVDQLGLWGAPALTTGSSWGVPAGTEGRPNIEIYNMPLAMASAEPPLRPFRGTSVPLYTYRSGVPADPDAGVVFPTTADQQPVFVLNRGPFDATFNRAICGFEPELLDPTSHQALVEFITVRHFRLGLGEDN